MNYPFELQRREAAAIRVRREKAAPFAASAKEEGEGLPEAALPDVDFGRLPPQTVGLALSGGGIRAAIFGLGIIQSLARKGRLREIDFLRHRIELLLVCGLFHKFGVDLDQDAPLRGGRHEAKVGDVD